MDDVRLPPGLLLVGLFLGSLGCSSGPALYPVAGEVKYLDGQPVTAGVVELQPEAGGPAARGTIDKEGRFQLSTGTQKGVLAGRHQIAIIQVFVAEGGPAGHRAIHRARLVHSRYRKFETSGLSCTVQPNRENFLTLEVEASRE